MDLAAFASDEELIQLHSKKNELELIGVVEKRQQPQQLIHFKHYYNLRSPKMAVAPKMLVNSLPIKLCKSLLFIERKKK